MTEAPEAVVHYARTAGIDVQRLLEAWAGELTGEESARLARLRQPADRRDYLAAHVLLRLALRDAPGSSYSLTHAAGLVACATLPSGAGSVGIDAERLDAAARLASIADVVASERERDQLDLVSIWVAKEAYLKQTGEGFSGRGGYAVLRALHAVPAGQVGAWTTVQVLDARRGNHARAWTRHVADHVIAVVSASDLAGSCEERSLGQG